MSTQYERLQDEIAAEGIAFHERHMPAPLRGLYVKFNEEKPLIVIEQRQDVMTKTCVCAEELGHHHNPPGNQLHASPKTYARAEDQARLWAYERLLHLDAICDAYYAYDQNPFAIAEALEVTKEFLDRAIQRYAFRYGVSMKTSRYFIRFIPYFRPTPI